jgi:hypothetical protein
MTDKIEISKPRMFIGVFILVTGFLSPLLIPFVTNTDWSVGVKSTISGLLAFGIPEIFMLIAVAIMGKQGYEFIKSRVLKYLKRFAPPDDVSLVRYRIGLFMFTIPIFIGIVQPYIAYYFPIFIEMPLWLYISFDVLFISSFFVLGGNFWDKLSGLFKHNVNVIKDV